MNLERTPLFLMEITLYTLMILGEIIRDDLAEPARGSVMRGHSATVTPHNHQMYH